MQFFGIENGKVFTLKGIATYTIERQIIGNGSTRNFTISIPEKITIPHVSLYQISGNGVNQIATRVKDNVYTVIINQSSANALQINFASTPANNVVYKILITTAQI